MNKKQNTNKKGSNIKKNIIIIIFIGCLLLILSYIIYNYRNNIIDFYIDYIFSTFYNNIKNDNNYNNDNKNNINIHNDTEIIILNDGTKQNIWGEKIY